jgi:hypothetical protein
MKTLLKFIFIIVFSSLYNFSFAEDDNPRFLDNRKKGERIFKGFTVDGKAYKSCIDCHLLKSTDTINWAPSAYDLHDKILNRPEYDIVDKLQNPTGDIFTSIHSELDLTENEILHIKDYIISLNDTSKKQNKSYFVLISIFLAIAIIVVFINIIYKLRYLWIKMISIGIVLISCLYIFNTLYTHASKFGRSQFYAPDQPIKFSHKVHSQQNKIDCKYCHHSVEYSKSATIPHMSLCLNCHSVVREGTRSGKFEIDKIHNSLDIKRAVSWNRIHSLPDHVFFSHAQHVTIGKLECVDCHGKVENQHLLMQMKSLSMGWCIDCHKQKHVDISNGYYSRLKGSTSVSNLGGRDCSKCHY